MAEQGKAKHLTAQNTMDAHLCSNCLHILF